MHMNTKKLKFAKTSSIECFTRLTTLWTSSGYRCVLFGSSVYVLVIYLA